MKKRYTFSPKTWLRAGLLTAVAATFSLSLQAQIAPAKLWDKTFGGIDVEYLTSLQQTTDGGYILGGYSGSGISGDKSQASRGDMDFWVVKLDASGNKLWDKTFGGSGNDELKSLQQTSDGGYILGGSSYSTTGGDKSQTTKGHQDYWVVKLDAGGNKLWDKTLGGFDDDELKSLRQTADGGYILSGHSCSGISGDKTQASKGGYDYWVVKLDAGGNKTWDKTIGGSSGDLFPSLQQTSDGGYILGGSSESGISGDKSQASKGVNDYWIIKLNASGNKTWDKSFGASGWDNLVTLQQTSDGGYILGGSTDSDIGGDKTQANKGFNDYWVVKLNASGNQLWDKTLGGSGYDYFASLQQTSDGGYILGGGSRSYISGDKSHGCQGDDDYWVVKLDASGNKTWDKTIGGSGFDILKSLQQTSDGGYILGGYSTSGISGDKTQANKGASQGSTDFWIVKLAGSVTGIPESESSLALSIFPNPSQGKFNLKLSGITAPSVGVTVSDMLGRMVLQQEIQATDQRISEELELPSTKGIYLLQLKAGEQITTRKIVVE